MNKRQLINDLVEDSERAANIGQMKEVYDITKKMWALWKAITEDPAITADTNQQHKELDINVDTVCKEQIKSVLT